MGKSHQRVVVNTFFYPESIRKCGAFYFGCSAVAVFRFKNLYDRKLWTSTSIAHLGEGRNVDVEGEGEVSFFVVKTNGGDDGIGTGYISFSVPP